MAFQKFLLLVVIGVLFMTLIIVIAFIIINKCFIKKVTKYNPASKQEESAKSNYEMKSTFQTADQDNSRPPLPSRKQFDTESVNSYEDIDSLHEESIKPKEFTLLQNTNTISRLGNQINVQDNKSLSESYDDVEDIDQKMGSSKGFSSVHNKPVEPVNSTLLQNSTIKHQHENQMNFRDDKCFSENYNDVDEHDQKMRPSYEGYSSVHNRLMEPAGAPFIQQPIINHQFDNQTDFQDDKSLSENYDDVEELDNDLGPSYKGFDSVHDELLEPAGAPFLQQPIINHQFENQTVFQDDKSLSENYDDVEELDNDLDNSYEDISTEPFDQTVPEESAHYQPATINLQFMNQVNSEDSKSLSDGYEEVDEIGFTVQHSYEDNAAQQEYIDFNENEVDSFDDYDGMEDNVSEDYVDVA